MAFTYATFVKASGGHPDSVSKTWSYTTADAITDLDASNYWAGAYARGARAGDFVLAACSDGGVLIYISALAAATSTANAVAVTAADSSAILAVQSVWVGPIACADYGTAGRVGAFVSPIAGTIKKWKHITDTVVTADNALNLDVGGTNCTGSITVAVSDTAVDIIDSATVSANGTVTEGALVKIESDGAGDTGAGRVWVLIQP